MGKEGIVKKPVLAKKHGKVKWTVKDNQKINSGERLGDIQIYLSTQAEFKGIPDTEDVKVLNWHENHEIKINYCGEDISGKIKERYDYKTEIPPTFNLLVAIENSKRLKEEKVFVSYPQKDLKLGVLSTAIIKENKENFLIVIKDGKVQRCKVQLGIQNSEGYTSVTGISKDDEIVVGKPSELEKLKDGQSIKIND